MIGPLYQRVDRDHRGNEDPYEYRRLTEVQLLELLLDLLEVFREYVGTEE